MVDSDIISTSDQDEQSDVESRSSPKRWRKSDSVDSSSRVIVAKVVPPTVKYLTLTRDMVLNIVGKHTGTRYQFNGAGSTVAVEEHDADIMLMEKSSHVSCCGGISSPYFEVR